MGTIQCVVCGREFPDYLDPKVNQQVDGYLICKHHPVELKKKQKNA